MEKQCALRERFASAMARLPLIAVMRGIRPEECEAIGKSLYDEGFRVIEVPLNSPDPLDSIARLRASLPADALVGAGTVLSAEKAIQVGERGGEMIFMPHADTSVIRAAKAHKLLCVPGVVTPTEAFSALAAGADALKIFPAELVTPRVLKSMRAVLPKDVLLLPFGGMTPETMKPYLDAGAGAFGLGSALYSPGMGSAEVAQRASGFAAAWAQLRKP